MRKRAETSGDKRTVKTPHDRLTLSLQGKRVPAAQFLKAVQSFVDLLYELTAELAGRRNAVSWLISVKSGSNVINADPVAQKPDAPVGLISRSIFAGMKQLNRRAIRPASFSDEALKRARDVASAADGTWVKSVEVSLENNFASIERKTVLHVDSIFGKETKDYGSIEGRLQTISVHGRAHFYVYDDLTDKKVDCRIPDTRLKDAISHFNERVSVSGIIRYREDGRPTSITVDRFGAMLPEEELPTIDDMCGILKE